MKPFLSLSLIIGFSACGKPAEVSTNVDVEAGKKTYAMYCAACHQHDGTGLASTGQRMGADYTAPNGPLAQSDEMLLAIINNGKTGTIGSMPAWRGIVSPQDQRNVLAYLRKAFSPDQ